MSTGKYVILMGIKEHNCFFSMHVPGNDPTKLADGTVAYFVLGYADTMWEAQEMLNIPERFITSNKEW